MCYGMVNSILWAQSLNFHSQPFFFVPSFSLLCIILLNLNSFSLILSMVIADWWCILFTHKKYFSFIQKKKLIVLTCFLSTDLSFSHILFLFPSEKRVKMHKLLKTVLNIMIMSQFEQNKNSFERNFLLVKTYRSILEFVLQSCAFVLILMHEYWNENSIFAHPFIFLSNNIYLNFFRRIQQSL